MGINPILSCHRVWVYRRVTYGIRAGRGGRVLFNNMVYIYIYIYGRIKKKGGGGKTPPKRQYGDFLQCLGSNDTRNGRSHLISYTMIVLGYLSSILVILKIFDLYRAICSPAKLAKSPKMIKSGSYGHQNYRL